MASDTGTQASGLPLSASGNPGAQGEARETRAYRGGTQAPGLPMFRTLLLALLLAGPCLISVAAQNTAEHKKVLLLYSDEPHAPSQIVTDRAMRETLQNGSPVPVQVYYEYLDGVRTDASRSEEDLVSLRNRKYEGKKFDVIFVFSDAYLRILLRNRSELFPGTPLVFLVLDHHNIADLNPMPNATGVWGEISLVSDLELALALHPDTKQVVLVGGVSDWDRYWTARAREEFRGYEGKLKFEYLTGLTPSQQEHALAALPPQTIVIFLTNTRDNAGNTYVNVDVLRQISPASHAPVYGTTDAQLGFGIVGGNILSYEALAVEAGKVCLRVLAGEKPEAIAPHEVPSRPMFDWRELRRWNIGEASLPLGSIVRFKQASPWDLYKWQIVGTISLVILQGGLIAYLLVNRARRRHAETESVRFAALVDAERQHLEQVVSNVPGIVWESRVEPGETTRRTDFINDQVEKMLGYTVDEWLATQGFWL